MQTASEITAIATAWLIRTEREATPELWEELQQWLDAHPRHRAEFIRQRTAWHRCDKLKMLRPMNGAIDTDLLSKIEFVPSSESHSDERETTRTRGGFFGQIDRSRRGWLAAAAATAGLAVLGAWYFTYERGWETYKTAVGGRQQIALNDGSTVDLNTDSVIRVHMSAGRRDIVLKRGEALFHVAHDGSRPFFVTAETTIVRAVGTAFSVRIREDNRVEVVVTEGRVAVGSPRIDTGDQPVLASSAAAVTVDEVAAVSHGRVSIKRLQHDEIGRKLAWTAGKLAFLGETLSEVVDEFNRYNLRHVIVADPSILQKKFGGVFTATDLDGFLATLEHSFHVMAIRPSGDGEVRLIAAPDAHSGDTMAPLEEPGVSSNHAAETR